MPINNNSGSSAQDIEQHEPQAPGKLLVLNEKPDLELTEEREAAHHTEEAHLQKWNFPRINMFRCFATFWSFICLGANDGAYGALIPYLEKYYNINYTIVSLVFLSPIVGYTCSALSNNAIHMRFGQRGVAIIMSGSHLIAYLVISQHPPYPVLVVVFILAGFGNGLGDAGWNAWIGDMSNANEVLGFLHAFYGLGAALAPLIATSLVTKGWEWYTFYYFMIGAAVLEILTLVGCFWVADGRAFRDEHPQAQISETASPQISPADSSAREEGMSSRILEKLKHTTVHKSSNRTLTALSSRVTWLSALFLLIYVGIEVSIGGWVVTFMLRVRHATPYASGVTATAFWAGITLGRIVLGFVTARLFRSEKEAVATYMVLAVVCQLLFWLVPSKILSSVMASLLGVCLGPLFPAAVVVMTKLLPKNVHVAAVGFAAAFGASGACVLPFAVGAIAQAKGVWVLQPIVLALLVACLGVWLCIPRLPKVRSA